jgi:hypothetical protein
MYSLIFLLYAASGGELDPKRLNIDGLLTAFIKFWRQQVEPLLGSTGYHEIAPHIVLMAFLHRVVNGGGVLEREYAIGSDIMDLCLQYKEVILGIELKVWRDKKRNPQADGIEQLESYLGRLGLDFGWLFIFDRRCFTYGRKVII